MFAAPPVQSLHQQTSFNLKTRLDPTTIRSTPPPSDAKFRPVPTTSASSTPSTSAFTLPAPPSPRDDTEIHAQLERRRYHRAILGEVTGWLGDLMTYCPESGNWAKLTGDAWDRDRCKWIIVNYLRSVIGRENDRGIIAEDARRGGQKYWDAAQGVAQILAYVEYGLPLLHEKMTEKQLILMGNTSTFIYDRRWRPSTSR